MDKLSCTVAFKHMAFNKFSPGELLSQLIRVLEMKDRQDIIELLGPVNLEVGRMISKGG